MKSPKALFHLSSLWIIPLIYWTHMCSSILYGVSHLSNAAGCLSSIVPSPLTGLRALYHFSLPLRYPEKDCRVPYTYVKTHSYEDVYISSLSFVPKCTVGLMICLRGIVQIWGEGNSNKVFVCFKLGQCFRAKSHGPYKYCLSLKEKQKKKKKWLQPHPTRKVLCSLAWRALWFLRQQSLSKQATLLTIVSPAF